MRDAENSENSDGTNTATVVYEDAHRDRTEIVVATEDLAYREDHWVLTLAVDGERRIRRIPRERVYHVDRPGPTKREVGRTWGLRRTHES